MIQGLVVKLIINAIMKAINKKHNLNKIDNYVNKPNEIDKEVKSMLKRLNKLEKDAHPRSDWICLECGCYAKKKEIPTKKGDK